MTDLGVNADPRFSTADIVASGARWARFPIRMSDDIGNWLVQAGTRGLQTVGVWDSHPDSLGDDESQWPERLAAGWRRYGSLLTVWQAGNECDAPEGSPSSWVMDQARISRLMRLAADVMPGARRWGPGLSSGHPEWAEGLPWETVRAVCCHPYAKEPNTPELEAMIAGYSDIARRAGIDLVVSEFDSRTPGMAAWLAMDLRIAVALVFAYGDDVQGFGLIDRNGDRRPSYYDFVAAAGQPVFADVTTGPPSFQLGFKAAHDSNPDLVGDPIQDEAWPVRGLSTQRTSLGQLFWADLKGIGSTLLFTANDGTRYLWRGDRLERVA